MKFKDYDRFQAEDVDLGDEHYNEKRNRRNKRGNGKRWRDSFEGRDRDWDWD